MKILNKNSGYRLIGPVVLLGSLICSVAAQETEPGSKVRIEPQEKWQTVFAGREAVYHFQITSGESIAGQAGWSLHHENRTISRGESAFEAGPGRTGLIEVRLNIPEVKKGVMLPVRLAVVLYPRDTEKSSQASGKKIMASYEQTLRVFHEDAFALKMEWLQDLEIGLFDPEEKTQEVFNNLNIPFLVQKNIDSLSEFDGSLLIVGSGLDFDEYRSLWPAILNVSAKGTPVLVLAPARGSVLIPGVEETELPEPGNMRFADRDIIRQLHKKLDAEAWPPDGRVVASSMVLKPNGTGLVGEFVPGEKSWPWFEADFNDKGGEKGTKIVVCGFAIVEQIEAGPSPRYLLCRLFEYLTNSQIQD